MNRTAVLILLSASLAVVSCRFKNDLDYPVIQGRIIDIQVEGQTGLKIDESTREAVIYLGETADIGSLKLLSVTYNEEATPVEPLSGTLDLRSPISLILRTYQDYEWAISAVQEIERYIVCDNQMEQARFNPSERMAWVYVADSQPLSSIVFRDMKLEPEGSEIISTTGWDSDFNQVYSVTEDVHFPMTLSCVLERTFDVKYKGETRVWTVKAIQVEVNTMIVSVDAYSYSAKLRGIFRGENPVIEYKKADSEEWTVAPDAVVAGVGISAAIEGLEDGQEYIARVRCDNALSPERHFTTEEARQLANMSFDDWHLDGKVWYPYLSGASGDQLIWDSANKATASFTGSATTPDEEFVAVEGEGKKAARLESGYAVVKFAAGNLFTGHFVKLAGLGAELAWGVPFTSRPVSVTGYMSYKTSPITDTDADHKDLLGKNDTGHMIVILTDWEEQFHLKSAEKVFVDFDNDPGIIAFGKVASSEDTDGYFHFDMPLEYRSSRQPTMVLIVASSSALGDYFTGGRGSVLHLDELEFVYK
ncbi:MAG: PCMD domain-containing protein [Bacteroidales bacterium]|nr:PCMD domain-containing protein [Bacteroidales bacterium]